jgi:hypothetical protein
MYEVGELSMMMVSASSRPTWERSCYRVRNLQFLGIAYNTYLDIVALMVITTFTEQAVMHYTVNVELVEKWIAVLKRALARCLLQMERLSSYLGDTGGEYNHFVKFSHSLHELIDTGSFNHVHVVILSLDFDWDREISLM